MITSPNKKRLTPTIYLVVDFHSVYMLRPDKLNPNPLLVYVIQISSSFANHYLTILRFLNLCPSAVLLLSENDTSVYKSSILMVSPGEMIFTFTSGANRAAKLANDLGGSARILGISHLNPKGK
jgi:hypothetical protein